MLLFLSREHPHPLLLHPCVLGVSEESITPQRPMRRKEAIAVQKPGMKLRSTHEGQVLSERGREKDALHCPCRGHQRAQVAKNPGWGGKSEPPRLQEGRGGG